MIRAESFTGCPAAASSRGSAWMAAADVSNRRSRLTVWTTPIGSTSAADATAMRAGKPLYPIGGHDDPAKANVRADQGSPVGCVRTANFGQELHAVGRERELQPAIGHGRRLDVRVEEDAPASKPGRECLGSVHDHGIGQTIVFRVEHHGVDQRRSRRRIEVSLERDPPACRDVQTGRTGVHRDRPFAVCQESDPALAVVVRDDACDTDGV